MEQFDTTIASLTYLTNPLYQQIIKQQKDIKTASNKNDVKFYRKRITSLTKDMLKGEIPDNSYIKVIYETYVNGLIKYFKMIDTADIIQQQYNSAEHVQEPGQCEEQNIHVDAALDTIKEVTIDNMDELLMRKISGPSTLDNFVIKTQHTQQDTRIIPVTLDINLKEPSLKTKGVKEKLVKEKLVKEKLVKEKPANENPAKEKLVKDISHVTFLDDCKNTEDIILST